MYECDICNKEQECMDEINGYHICDDCQSKDNYHFCQSCDTLIHEGDEIYIDGDYYCDECAVECSCCDAWIVRDEGIVTAHDNIICQSCYDNEYVTCERCGDVIDYESSSRIDDNYYCEYCYENALEDYNIHPYGYKPDCEFLSCDDEAKLRKNNLHIGIELEIEGDYKADFCQDMSRTYDYNDDVFYLKMDGSLSDNGIEIVSQPMTYKYIFEGGKWIDVFDKMRENEMNDTCGCGLHFHIDKEYLDEKSISMIDFMVNTFDEYFSTLGGRDYSDEYYCHKRVKDISDWGKNTDSRYSAVNLCCCNTVELRFCSSTSDFDVFMQRVRMVFTIVEFAKQYTIKKVMNWKKETFLEKFNTLFKEMFGNYPDFLLD